MAAEKTDEAKDRNIVKTVSMKVSMVEKIERKALDEGHGNFSRVVVSAIDAYIPDGEKPQERRIA